MNRFIFFGLENHEAESTDIESSADESSSTEGTRAEIDTEWGDGADVVGDDIEEGNEELHEENMQKILEGFEKAGFDPSKFEVTHVGGFYVIEGAGMKVLESDDVHDVAVIPDTMQYNDYFKKCEFVDIDTGQDYTVQKDVLTKKAIVMGAVDGASYINGNYESGLVEVNKNVTEGLAVARKMQKQNAAIKKFTDDLKTLEGSKCSMEDVSDAFKKMGNINGMDRRKYSRITGNPRAYNINRDAPHWKENFKNFKKTERKEGRKVTEDDYYSRMVERKNETVAVVEKAIAVHNSDVEGKIFAHLSSGVDISTDMAGPQYLAMLESTGALQRDETLASK